ncbi:MAG TPA: AMP-binding protein [Solimonas sp.]|nr:AMP-binding protein [Solimonas sp.]
MSAGTLPLVAGFQADTILAWRRGKPVSQGEYVAQALALAARLPDVPYAINLCEDRYCFMLAFAAAGLRGQTSLLPSSASPAAIEAVRSAYPQCHIVTDESVGEHAAGSAAASPQVPAGHVAAVLFTSGSTGAPQAHAKTWLTFSVIPQHLSQRLLAERPASIVATVPPQHMYGIETTVLMGLGAGCAVHAGRPFFPQDIVQALAEVPAPRMLVTTPVHLRALVAAGTRLPELSLVLSATAPLSAELAAAAEAAWGAPVHEIYGCTEAGSMASRRTVEGEVWEVLPEMKLSIGADGASIAAPHLPEAVPLHDLLEATGPARFRMLGRTADLLKVAGKRASLADLTGKLLAVPGVEDAVIFNAGEGEAARPAALVVAPDLSEAAILEALGRQVDAVFLPRPLRKVARLPRNALGKLPREALLELLGK